jgi:hypothetical protein
LKELHHVEAGVALANGAKMAGAGVGFAAPGGFGERPGSFGARGAVVGQKIHVGLPQYCEPFRRGVRRDQVAALPGSRWFHVTRIPGPSPVTRIL